MKGRRRFVLILKDSGFNECAVSPSSLRHETLFIIIPKII